MDKEIKSLYISRYQREQNRYEWPEKINWILAFVVVGVFIIISSLDYWL